MKRSKGIIVIIVFLLLLSGLTYTAVMGIGAEKTGAASGIKQGLDLAGGVSITYEVMGEEDPSGEDMADTIYKLQKRVEDYSTEAQVYQEGSDRINIDIPGVSDANAILKELGRPGTLYFISQTDSNGNENYTMDYNTFTYKLNKTIEELIADGSVVLTGTEVKAAQPGSITNDMGNSEYAVDLTFTKEGGDKFAVATKRAFQAQETIAIYYDGTFVSVPSVNSVIENGQAQITNMESFEAAEKLASTIRIGGLKLQLQELRSNVVGAQLGETAIQTSLQAGAIGFAIVVIFMLVVYLIPGLASVLALSIYVGLMIVCLNLFEITLTLPGIAGIILSIGMAVDANVIIFARIKEELAKGKTVSSAIKLGFEKALSAIVDGNVTTLIAALVLGLKGSGSVKGFAETLAMGIVISMFTALFVTKLIIRAFYAVGLRDVKLYGIAKERKTINFLSKRNIFFGVSLAVIAAGFVFMGVNKSSSMGQILNYSLEFKGGTATNVIFNEDMSIGDIETEVLPVVSAVTKDKNIQTQKVAGSNAVIIKTRTLSVGEREALDTALSEQFQVEAENITAETISSTVSNEMKADAFVAVLIATACMLLYIWFRFKDVRFAASAVIALVHDVLIVLAFYTVARISVGSNFIACMLTIVGYSINATIVIFDRIRENLKEMKRNEDLQEMVNRSITQTLARSIFTSFTTFIMIAMLFVLGVASIREFALPLMVGILCGTYSSVCITGSLWYTFKTKFLKKEEIDNKVKLGKSKTKALN